MKKDFVPIEDLESLADWYFELTLIKGYTDFDALSYMSTRTTYKAMIQLASKIQLDKRLVNKVFSNR